MTKCSCFIHFQVEKKPRGQCKKHTNTVSCLVRAHCFNIYYFIYIYIYLFYSQTDQAKFIIVKSIFGKHIIYYIRIKLVVWIIYKRRCLHRNVCQRRKKKTRIVAITVIKFDLTRSRKNYWWTLFTIRIDRTMGELSQRMPERYWGGQTTVKYYVSRIMYSQCNRSRWLANYAELPVAVYGPNTNVFKFAH